MDESPTLCPSCGQSSPTPDAECPGASTGHHDLITVRVLDLTPTGRYADGSPSYSFHTSFPSGGVRVIEAGRDYYRTEATPGAAYSEGMRYVGEYESRDRYGNMGEVLGVAKIDGGYRAVVNTYHSNT